MGLDQTLRSILKVKLPTKTKQQASRASRPFIVADISAACERYSLARSHRSASFPNLPKKRQAPTWSLSFSSCDEKDTLGVVSWKPILPIFSFFYSTCKQTILFTCFSFSSSLSFTLLKVILKEKEKQEKISGFALPLSNRGLESTICLCLSNQSERSPSNLLQSPSIPLKLLSRIKVVSYFLFKFFFPRSRCSI